jgi:hypothetical protein
VSEKIDRMKVLMVLEFAEKCKYDLAIRRLRDKYDPGWFDRKAHQFALKHPEVVLAVRAFRKYKG